MFSFLTFLFRAVFNLLKSKKGLIVQICLLKKELEILKRQNQKKRLKFHHYMIHDHAAQFNLNYGDYGIKGIYTSVIAPNMNALAERFLRSVRLEALDYYLLISEKQIMRILQEYQDYYNSTSPHQGINQGIPMGYKPQFHGKVQKISILGGLCNHYVRSAA
jgi:hypothetical protein